MCIRDRFLVIIPIIIPGITKFRQISKIYTGSIKKISPKITIAKDMKIPLVSDNAAITTNNEETLIVNIPVSYTHLILTST